MSVSCSFLRRGSRHVHGHRHRCFLSTLSQNDKDDVENADAKRRHPGIAADRRRTPQWRSSAAPTNAAAAAFRRRSYHATPQRQILPLLAAGIAGIAAAYGYRALRQMDADWEDYSERWEEYDEAARSDSGANRREASHFAGGTLAVDLGTSFLKVAHRDARPGGRMRPEVVVDREGHRAVPAWVWMSSREEAEVLVGRLAAARRYDSRGGRVLPAFDALRRHHGDDVLLRGVRQSIRMAASDALEQVLGGDSQRSSSSSSSSSLSSAPLFVLDPSMAFQGAYNARPVFTYPPHSSLDASSHNHNHADDALLQRYMNVVQPLVSPKDIALFLPEPVAALAGAEYYNLLPQSSSRASSSIDDNISNKSVAVVDVGGTTTRLSIVSSEHQHHNVVYSSSMPWGGDTFVDLLTRHLIRCFYGPHYDTVHRVDRSNDNDQNSSNVPSTQPTLNDPTALQRLYDASTTALQELSRKTRCRVHIPYLSMDMQTRQPKHLEVDVARSIVEAEVETFLRNDLVSYLLQNSNPSHRTVLSEHLPPPTDLSALFSSALASAMEQTSRTPQSLRAVLLVGGGSRIPLVRQAMRRGAATLGGDIFLDRLVMPEGEMGMELTVLGAALWGSGGGRDATM